MLLSTFVIAALGASTTFASPLLGSLWARSKNSPREDTSLPHLNSRDVDGAALDQMPKCHRDDLYSLFTNEQNRGAVRDYCSIYIASSSIVGVVTTTTVTATVSLTTTAATITITAAANSTTPTQPCESSNTTQILSTASSPNATLPAFLPPPRRQLLPTPFELAGTYPPLRLSSACSCLVTPSTFTTTWTSYNSVAWTIETITETVTGTVTVQPTDEISQTQDATTTVNTASDSQTANGTAEHTTNITMMTSNNTADATATVTISQSLNNTTASTITIPSFPSTFAAPPFPNNTAGDTFTTPTFPNNTAVATATISPRPHNATNATVTVLIFPNNTANANANATATISHSPNNTANATATFPQTQNSTATPVSAQVPVYFTHGSVITDQKQGLPEPTGTNSSSSTPYCNETFVRGNGTYRARYMVQCSYSYVNLRPIRVVSRPSFGECVRECDDDARCYAFSFLLAGDAKNCYIYNYYPLPLGQPDNLFNSGAYVVASNNGMKR